MKGKLMKVRKKPLAIEYVKTSELVPYAGNAKEHPADQIEQIKKSILDYGMNDPIAIWHGNEIIEGHGRLIACEELGIEEVPVIRLDDLTDEERREYALVHNKLTMNSGFDEMKLDFELSALPEFDASFFGFDAAALAEGGNGAADNYAGGGNKESLQNDFIVPPFSTLDTRRGYWQDRKRAWKALGIKSEEGRENDLLFGGLGDMQKVKDETSVFDPVLCEIMYTWFNVKGGKIFDPFAGGSVRGIVAAFLGYDYTGIDLRPEQVEVNRKNAEALGYSPKWICDDSMNADAYIKDGSVDMIMSCPPYADLEVYSDDPRDISNMDYDSFLKAYRAIIEIAVRKLKEDRFIVWTVGEVRDKKGFYRDFVSDTKKAFIDAGAFLYNDFVLIEAVGSGAIRARKQFNGGRKAVKNHQNVLVFYKGNPKNITANYGEVIPADFAIEEENDG